MTVDDDDLFAPQDPSNPDPPSRDERTRMSALSFAFDMRHSAKAPGTPATIVANAEIFLKFLSGEVEH